MSNPQRKIESSGKIYIPIKFFRSLNFSKNQEVEIIMEYGAICIKKFSRKNLRYKSYVGIVRRLDNKQRVSIPWEYLRLMHLKEGDTFDTMYDGGKIIIFKEES